MFVGLRPQQGCGALPELGTSVRAGLRGILPKALYATSHRQLCSSQARRSCSVAPKVSISLSSLSLAPSSTG